MRTLFLTQDFPPSLGGIARLYGQLCRHLPPGSVEVCTVALPPGAESEAWPSEPPSSEASSEHPAVPVHRMPFSYRRAKLFSNVVRWALWTRGRLRRGDIGLLHAGDLRPSGYVAAAMRALRGVPYVVYVHGYDVWKESQRVDRSPRRRWTARWILGGAGAVIANSRPTAALAESLLTQLGLPTPPSKVRVVHPGTDPDRFRPDAPGREAWRRELVGGDGKLVLSVARLVPSKGIDTALEAFARILPRYPDAVYAVAGTGTEKDRLEHLANELGVADRVRFLGTVSETELPGLFAAADLFVLPSRVQHGWEGFGIVFSEASASGVAVIGGASGGVPDAVRDGETGLLVPAADVDALAAAMDRLLGDDALRRRLGAAGRRWVETYYQWDRVAAETWAICEEVARR